MLQHKSGPADDSVPQQRRAPSPVATAAPQEGAAAWPDLVAGHLGEVWSAARAAGLSTDDAAEVSELTWLRLACDLDRVMANGTDLRTWLLDTVTSEVRVVSARSALDQDRDARS